MNKAILIIIGFVCAIISAAFIITYLLTHNQQEDECGNSRRHLSLNELIGRLKSEDEGIFDCGCMMVEYSGAFSNIGEKAIPEIIALLKDKNERVRWSAVNALSEFRYKEAIPELIRMLSDADWGVRQTTIDALGDLDAREAIPKIIKLLDDESLGVQSEAVRILGKFGAKEVIPQIKELLKDKNDWVRIFAEQALKKLGVPEEEIEKAKGK